jgi:calcineurin-like phosphoesterase family protein
MGKNKNIFVTSDVWFNRPIGEYASMTNGEYNDMIIDNWNSAVSNGDVVYVLGGFGIGDCYDIVLKLNGEIHFLNSIFSHSDSVFRNAIKEGVDNSVNKDMRKRVIFENNQILAIPKADCVLSYFPLNDWAGKSTGTICFHGYTDKHNLSENNISCKVELWAESPVNIKEIRNNFSNFKKLLSK